MTKLTISIEPLKAFMKHSAAAMKEAMKGKAQGHGYSFQSVEDFSRMLTPNRWGILNAMTGAGPMSIRELARRLDRDVKGVHTDVQALLNVGLIDKADDGGIVFPYDAVHVDFTVKPAQAA